MTGSDPNETPETEVPNRTEIKVTLSIFPPLPMTTDLTEEVVTAAMAGASGAIAGTLDRLGVEHSLTVSGERSDSLMEEITILDLSHIEFGPFGE